MVQDPSRKKELRQGDFDLMRLPEIFRDLRYEDFKDLESYDELASYLKNLDDHLGAGRGCLILGEPHTGKSTKAAYVAIVAAQYRHHVRWTTAVQLHDQIVNREIDDVDQITWRQKQLDVGLLVIDDLTNEWECYKRPGHILQFLTDRIHAGLPTVVTCPVGNLDLLEKRGIYPPQMISKLRHHFVPLVSFDQFPSANLGG